MIRWTTPILKCTIPKDLVFDYLILTLAQDKVVIEKRVEFSEVSEGEFSVAYTQEETSRFVENNRYTRSIEAQINFISGENRFATNILSVSVSKNLHNGLI